MNGFGFLFTGVMAILVWALPRRWVALPFLMGAGYMHVTQEIEIGPLHFPITRILVTVGFLRTMSKGERLAGGMNTLDRLMLAWAGWAVLSSLFHVSGELISRLGMIYTALGAYFLFRIFVQDVEDIYNVFKIVCIVFVPLALSMLFEKLTGRNLFALLGGAPDTATVRNGKFRAQGPFAHAILAGTSGAACLPMALLLWRQNRRLALIGIFATASIIYASGASGPVMAILTILFGMFLWNYRKHLSTIRWMAVAVIVGLSVVMKDPVYYLIARIDITGGSTGWHRARLIDAAIDHLSNWFFIGTDYTRNWMPTGVYWNPNHTDITNHYLQMGVWGGMPLMLLFIAILWAAFVAVGKALRATEDKPVELQFLVWSLGAMLFGHATNFISVCYFDQSVVFIYLLLANIGCLQAITEYSEETLDENIAPENPEEYEADLSYNS
jgi:hypothetical protein